MTKRALIVFLKNPEPGKVKTRLCGRFSPEQAAALYRAMAEDVIESHAGRGAYDLLLFYSPEEAEDSIRDWLGGDQRLISQAGEDLGERQYNAFRRSFALGYQRVMIIGTDCPGISTEDVVEAFEVLEGSDLVLGPSEDGGYYLIGCSSAPRYLRSGVIWSTSGVLEQVLERAAEAGQEYRLLERKFDIDTCEDVERLHGELKDGTLAAKAPATSEVLRSLMGESK